jgi:hypothetical protein
VRGDRRGAAFSVYGDVSNPVLLRVAESIEAAR